MSEITFRFHSETAAPLIADGDRGARLIAAAVRRAVGVLQKDGRNVAYAPLVLGDGRGCAMSVRPSRGGLLVEVDAPGTLLPGRGTVRDARYPVRAR